MKAKEKPQPKPKTNKKNNNNINNNTNNDNNNQKEEKEDEKAKETKKDKEKEQEKEKETKKEKEKEKLPEGGFSIEAPQAQLKPKKVADGWVEVKKPKKVKLEQPEFPALSQQKQWDIPQDELYASHGIKIGEKEKAMWEKVFLINSLLF